MGKCDRSLVNQLLSRLPLKLYTEDILYHKFLQFKFFEQWKKLRTYTNSKNIQIIGDVSIYVCHNSAEVWGNLAIFKLDPKTFAPAYIAGVPPDYFSATKATLG